MKKFTTNQTYESYFIKSKGTWKVCKKPKRKPDHISFKRNFKRIHPNDNPLTCLGDKQKYYKHHFEEEYDDYIRVYYEDKRLGISSRYWYGEDSRGKYIIRESDHWGRVASCVWNVTKDNKNKNLKCAKIYLN